jgi:hypothetical protein
MKIQFGDWQLRRRDNENWELYHRHAVKENHMTVKNGTAGEVRWHSVGRYYQKSTFASALEYAADWDLRNGVDGVVGLDEFIRLYADTLERHKTAFAASTSSN